MVKENVYGINKKVMEIHQIVQNISIHTVLFVKKVIIYSKKINMVSNVKNVKKDVLNALMTKHVRNVKKEKLFLMVNALNFSIVTAHLQQVV